MKKLEFSEDDFYNEVIEVAPLAGDAEQDAAIKCLVHTAQNRFDRWYASEIENGELVYLSAANGWHQCEWTECKHTHTAKLIDIKEIEGV